MLRLLHNTNYDFVRPWKLAVGITLAFLLAGAASFAVTGGINYSIEFTGGTLMQLEFKEPPQVSDVRTTLEQAGIHGVEIQQFGSNREFTVRAQDRAQVAEQAAGAETVARAIETQLTQRFGEGSYTIVRTEAVGPRVGSELRRNAVIAILISFMVTLVYLAIRFEWRLALAAIIATAHDTVATVAFIKLMNIEVSLTVIAAILTVIGYSLNDTIIVFDRLRENFKRHRHEPLAKLLNMSINQTLPRSVLTHLTTLAATLALLLFAGEVIRPFAWVMSFGIFTGTFSSIYIAGMILLWIERRWPRAVGGKPGAKAAAPRPGTPARPARQTASR